MRGVATVNSNKEKSQDKTQAPESPNSEKLRTLRKKKIEEVAVPTQAKPNLTSLKRIPSFSFKDAMAGKASASSVHSALSNSSDTDEDTYDNSEEIEDTAEVEVDEVEFTAANLEKVWVKLANQIKTSRPRIGNALLSSKPSIVDDNLITYDVLSPQQKEELMSIYNEIINYLRKALGSPVLELDFNVAEIESVSARPYTVDEKFKAMIVKNPAVLTLKQALGLDFE